MEIVFIHLNTRLPSYLCWNLKAHIEKFPQHKVTLIHSAGQRMPSIEGLTLVPAMEDARWQELDSLYTHPKEFRSNFWLTSSARLFALENYITSTQQELIHVESDVILSPDFPFSRFSGLEKGLAFPLISDSRGVASVVYLRDTKAANLLTSTLISEAKKNAQTTEMLSLKKVYESSPTKVCILPIGNSNPNFYRNIAESRLVEIMSTFRIFGGIFDGVEIGQFFLGTDPRNRRGKQLIRHDLVDGYINIKSLKLDHDTKRRFLNVVSTENNNVEPLYAVHVPSKEVKFFKSKTQDKALRHMCLESINGAKTKLSFTAVTLGILKSILRRVNK